MEDTKQDPALQERAVRLYPDNPYLQCEWLRAVEVVRTTAQGWKLDQPVLRLRQPLGRPQ